MKFAYPIMVPPDEHMTNLLRSWASRLTTSGTLTPQACIDNVAREMRQLADLQERTYRS